MNMIHLKASALERDGSLSDEIEFSLHEDLIEMIIDDQYFFQTEDEGYVSKITIGGKEYAEIKKVVSSGSGYLGSIG